MYKVQWLTHFLFVPIWWDVCICKILDSDELILFSTIGIAQEYIDKALKEEFEENNKNKWEKVA